jgi:hypothetical protein
MIMGQLTASGGGVGSVTSEKRIVREELWRSVETGYQRVGGSSLAQQVWWFGNVMRQRGFYLRQCVEIH